jgi:cysteine desulfurase/selenocysteine lyase
MEHHSNIVPWQILAQEKQAHVRYIPFTAEGTLDLTKLDELINENTKIVSFAGMSNVFGTINPAKEIIAAAQAVGAVTVIDAAQTVPHMAVDVQDLDCDFLAFSSHKMCGPTGIGILYGKQALLEAMPPFMGGGDMIRKVRLEGSTWADLPHKFEAGTPSIAEGIGLGTAVDYLSSIGMEVIHAHEQFITGYALEALSEIVGLRLLGPPAAHIGGVAAFTLEGIHPHYIAQLLELDGFAVRAGHHCAMPLHVIMSISASARASFYLYTMTEEVDKLVAGLHRVKKVFRR